jgi:hypothetical protein
VKDRSTPRVSTSSILYQNNPNTTGQASITFTMFSRNEPTFLGVGKTEKPLENPKLEIAALDFQNPAQQG